MRLSYHVLVMVNTSSECNYYGAEIVYGDAPGGKDWASQTTRLIQVQANALRVKSNRDNALGGNIACVLAGKVPAHRAPYGYIYRAEKIFEPRTGRAEYNANGRVPNPNRPLGDLTLGIKRTLLSPKPEEERVTFAVSPLTTMELWKKAKQSARERWGRQARQTPGSQETEN